MGDDMRVPTLSGNVKLKIPSGTQSGDILRLKGKGMTDITRPTLKGSQHVRIKVKVPKPNGKTRKLWEELKKLDSEKPSFLDRMRNKFG
jgi:molecular chaperone DnaJ